MLSPDCISQLPGQTKLRDLLDEQHQETMKNILSDWEFDQKTSLAIDDWTTPNKKLSFLGINCYYINWDWKYCEKLIEFEPVLDAHTD